jgi:hypothetical protein
MLRHVAIAVVLFFASACSKDSLPTACCTQTEQAMINCDLQPTAPVCGGPVEPCDPCDPPPPAALAAPTNFNGGFEARAMPPLSSCSRDSAGVLYCPWPTSLPDGWTVSPNEVYLGSRGHGGTFFQYGAGRVWEPSYGEQYPNVPDNTALMLQTCYTQHDPAWCEGTVLITSRVFDVSASGNYRLSMWLRSTLFMASYPPYENRTRLTVRFLDANLNQVAADSFTFAPNAAPIDWTFGSKDVVVPGNATKAQVVIGVDRLRQSMVYIDDVALDPR